MGIAIAVLILVLLASSSLALSMDSPSDTSSSDQGLSGSQDPSVSDLSANLPATGPSDATDAEIFNGGLSMKLSAADIAGYAAGAGFSGPDLAVAVAIAFAESGGNPAAVGDKSLAPKKGPSIGLWQIDMGTSEHAADFPGWDMTDPQQNANAAFVIYQRAGMSFRPWSTFNGGQYLAYLNEAQAATA